MAFGPSTSWQTEGEKVETMMNFILGGSNITADIILKDACSLEDKLTNLDSIMKKQRHHFANKGPL